MVMSLNPPIDKYLFMSRPCPLVIVTSSIETMAEGFLGTLWPLFGFARMLGLFPCKRLKNENGQIELVPISWKVQLTLLIICSCCAIVPNYILSVYHGFLSGKSFGEINQCLMQILYGNETIIDVFVQIFFFAFTTSSYYLICLENYRMKRGLCELSLNFYEIKKKKSVNSVCILILMFLIWSICVSFNVSWVHFECLCVSSQSFIILMFVISMILMSYMLLPMVIAFGVAMEVYGDLYNEAEEIQGDNFNLAKILYERTLF